MLKQKTVYFREEDLPLWDKIGNKAEWLHEHLKLSVEDIKMAYDPKTKLLRGKPIGNTLDTDNTNIKVNDDGTISPKDISKPSKLTTYTPPEPTA